MVRRGCRNRAILDAMPGGIVMAVILIVLFPIAVIMGCCVIAWLLGTLLTDDAEQRYEGTELAQLDS
jgi:hypothetical protein